LFVLLAYGKKQVSQSYGKKNDSFCQIFLGLIDHFQI